MALADSAAPASPVDHFEQAIPPLSVAELPPRTRPLRPTPILTPAIRTPLYIPALPEVPASPVAESPLAELPAAVDARGATGGAADLPWIDAFVGIAPEAMAVVTPPTTQSVDEWPLEEAAGEFDALGAQLALEPTAARSPSPAFAPASGEPVATVFQAMPAWTDDDLPDIQPPPSPTRTSVADPYPSAEEAAHALELLAQRVRTGDLMLPSYDPRMGEPAALVAALAALLGVRNR